MDPSRYKDIIAEQEQRSQCSNCHGLLEPVEVPYEGFGRFANAYFYLHCSTCDLYYIGYNEEDLRE